MAKVAMVLKSGLRCRRSQITPSLCITALSDHSLIAWRVDKTE